MLDGAYVFRENLAGGEGNGELTWGVEPVPSEQPPRG